MAKTLKEKTAQGLLWSIIDKFGQQGIYVVVGIIMAQLLSPADFGLIGVLTVFTVMASLFQESGFSAALIRKQDASPHDFSSVFYFNITISLIIYLILFFLAPLLARFFNQEQLIPLSRALFLTFFINSFGIIQYTTLTKAFRFRLFAIINFFSILVSGIIGIYLAYTGKGPWALAVQLIAAAFLKSALLWTFGNWRPTAGFRLQVLKDLFPFSIKVFGTNLASQLAANLYPSLIGRFFNPVQVGYYTQAYKWQILPLDGITTPIQNVSYPLLSELQQDRQRQLRIFRKLVRVTSFISFPALLGFILIAREVVLIFLSSKWEPSILILQILTAGSIFYPLYTLICSCMRANGYAKTILNLEIFRNLFILINLFSMIKWGIIPLIIVLGIINISFFFVNFTLLKKIIGYTWKAFAGDLIPFLAVAGVIILFNAWIASFIPSLVWSVCYKISATLIFYIGLLKIFNPEIIDETINFFKKRAGIDSGTEETENFS